MTTLADYIQKVNTSEGKIPCYMDRGNHWVGFDFDRTLATYHKWTGPGELGEPIMPMLELLRETHKHTECRIFTARVWPLIHFDPHSLRFTWDDRRNDLPERDQEARIGGALAATRAIRAWCDEHLGFQLAITNVKDIHCVKIYDDIARQVEPNTGRLLGGNNIPNIELDVGGKQ